MGLALFLICHTIHAADQTVSHAQKSQLRTTADQISQERTILSVPSRSGSQQQLIVEIDDWRCTSGETDMQGPDNSAIIVTVRNGSLLATMAGIVKVYQTGDFWTLPGGKQMKISITAPRQGAILRTIVAIPGS
jgi:hypothetical protein